MNRQARIEIGFAVTIIVLGLYLYLGSGDINLGSGYDRIGPRFFPYVIAAGLIITAFTMLVDSWFKRQNASALSITIKPLILCVTGLVICVITLERLGFVISVTLLFIFIARAFNSMRWLRDAVVGFTLAVVVYFIFTRGLGLVLPLGILGGLI